MRIIKFRAWDKVNNQMHERVTQINYWSGQLTSVDVGITILRESNFELMQFTGLTDKTGKEIYEGDVMQPKDMHDSNIDYWHMTNGRAIPHPRIVEWKKVGFNIPEDVEYWEVIGNIYENPELLTNPHDTNK